MLNYLHPDEKRLILGSANSRISFYDVWVKKEAFLKAIGTGLTSRLDKFCCTGDSIRSDGMTWHFVPVDIHEDYAIWVCSADPVPPVTQKIDLPRQRFLNY